jgi:hypothetical protein
LVRRIDCDFDPVRFIVKNGASKKTGVLQKKRRHGLLHSAAQSLEGHRYEPKASARCQRIKSTGGSPG